MVDRLFDTVIVGAGPAGCVLARRLTEDPARTVALLEAGPDYGPDSGAWPPEMRDPGGIFPESHSWGYVDARNTDDDPQPLPRARVVGGSSTINACVWLRGSAADYDTWAAFGNPGWSFADMLPYFKRAESDPLGGPFHGADGPVPVSRIAAADLDPVERAFVAAAENLGFPWSDDLNGDAMQHPSVGATPKNVANGERMHAARTYLDAARQRPNLTIFPDSLVDVVCIEDGRATGVRTADGLEVRGRTVVLCAGAYGSPAILLRSGVGPAAELQALGIPVVSGRPGVGAHLLDHPMLMFDTGPELDTFTIDPRLVPASPAAVPVLIKVRTRQATSDIDLFLICGQEYDVAEQRWMAFFLLNLEETSSRGWVRLTSRDPEATLDIDHAHLSVPTELEACCDGMELLRRLVATPPLSDVLTPVPGRVPTWRDRDDLRSWVRGHVTTTFHPSSTCRMGPASDAEAVVDRAGRVYGVDGLRIADASVFPTSPRANLHCTVVAVAEKLADAIRADG